MDTERLLKQLAAMTEETMSEPAPARLKANIYSSLVREMSAGGPLRSLPSCAAEGARLCVFEHLVGALPGERLSSANPCRTCHARLMGERLEWAPIFWPGCPYSHFHNP